VSRHLVLDDGRSQRELLLRERLTVGRDPACDVSDSDPRLSRRHAEFSLTALGLHVKDLESRNGVRVNGRFVKDALLSPGDLVEIGHLRLRFVDDADPAGQAQGTVSPRPVDQIQVKDGIEDDRTRVIAAPPMSTLVSGVVSLPPAAAVAMTDPGETLIRKSRPAPARLSPAALGVQDLMASVWGWRVLGQGVLLAGIVFLMAAIPMLNWFSSVTGPISTGLLLRMLAAPLLASLFAGLMVASLIARTTARALRRDDRSKA
jgi:hypothetical protein